MAMTCVVENARPFTRAHDRHHTGEHWPQPCPWCDCIRIYAGEQTACPFKQGRDSASTDVSIEIIELGSSCDAKAIFAQTAGHDLRVVIEKADPRRSCARRV